MAKGKGRSQWTEIARLQVVRAVMKVESEMTTELNGRVSGRGTAKWDRVIQLLPPELRHRTWNSRTNTYNQYKCCRLFYGLLNAYGTLVGRPLKSTLHLTKAEFQLFRERDDLLKARVSRPKKCSSKSDSLSNSNEEGSSDGESSGSEGEPGAPSLEKPSKESESLQFYEVFPRLHGDLKAGARNYSASEMSHEIPVASESREPDRLTRHGEEEGDGNRTGLAKFKERRTSHTTIGCGLLSTESVDKAVIQSKPSARSTPGKTQAQTRARETTDVSTPARQPAKRSRASRAGESQSTTSMMQPSGEESLDAISDKPLLKCVDREFEHLSCWVEKEAVPVAREVVYELTSVALESSKIRKGNSAHRLRANGPFQGLMSQSSVEMIDNRICALFHKLRIRVAEELKSACADIADIAQELAEGA